MTTPSSSSGGQPRPDDSSAPRHEISDRDRQILRRRREGRTLDEIGQEVGLTREGVRQVLVKRGGPSGAEVRAILERERREREIARQEAIRRWLVDNGPATVDYVAESLHIDAQTVSRLWPPDQAAYRVNRQTAARRWKDDEIMEALRHAATYEYPLRRATYDTLVDLGEVSGPKAVRIMQVFGTWRSACELAGVETLAPRREAYNSTWTDTDLWGYVREYLSDAEGPGTFAGFDAWLRNRDGAPSSQTIRNRLGAWNHVKTALPRQDT
jgi:hypothetical protein